MELRGCFEVPLVGRSASRLFVVGSFGRRRTIDVQQIRSLNLVANCLEKQNANKPQRLAVVGGGPAGLTAAVAAAELGYDVVVYEQKRELFALFAGGTKRYLDPHLFDWPAPVWREASAGLPFLSWRGDTAESVAKQLRSSWKSLFALYRDNLSLELGCPICGLVAEGERWRLKRTDVPRPTQAFDLVVLSVGFSLEKTIPGIRFNSYWRDDALEQYLLDPAAPAAARPTAGRFLVSGNGDGGLVEVLRLKLAGFKQGESLRRLLAPHPEIDRLASEVLEIEGSRNDSDEEHDRRYQRLRCPQLEERIEAIIRQNNQVQVVLAGTGPAIIRGPFPINKCLVAQLINLRAVTYHRTRPTDPDPAPDSTGFVVPGEPGLGRFNEVIVRRGTRTPPQVIGIFGDSDNEPVREGLRRLEERTGSAAFDPTSRPTWSNEDSRGQDELRSRLREALGSSVEQTVLELVEALLLACHDHRSLARHAAAVPEELQHFQSELTLVIDDLDPLFITTRAARNLLAFMLARWERYPAFVVAWQTALGLLNQKGGQLYQLFRLRAGLEGTAVVEEHPLLLEERRAYPVAPFGLCSFGERGAPVMDQSRDYRALPGLAVCSRLAKCQVTLYLHDHPDSPFASEGESRLAVIDPRPDQEPPRFSKRSDGRAFGLGSPPAVDLDRITALLGEADAAAALLPELSLAEESAHELVAKWSASGSTLLIAGTHHDREGGVDVHHAACGVGRRVLTKLPPKSTPCDVTPDDDRSSRPVPEAISATPALRVDHFKVSGTQGTSPFGEESKWTSTATVICQDLFDTEMQEALKVASPSLVLVPACSGLFALGNAHIKASVVAVQSASAVLIAAMSLTSRGAVRACLFSPDSSELAEPTTPGQSTLRVRRFDRFLYSMG